MLRQKKFNRCTVETLESRQLFAVTVAMPAPDTLSFTGNFEDDYIHIDDNGSGVVRAWVSSATTPAVLVGPIAGIRRLIINTGDGNDQVDIMIRGDVVAGGTHEIQCDLGNGNDWYRWHDITTATGFSKVGFNDRPVQRVLGGKGNDSLNYIHRGEIDGKVAVTLDGGTENDVLYAEVLCTAGSAGAFGAALNCGTGKDKATLLVRKAVAADPIAINAHATSGPDLDWDTVTRTALATDDGLFSAVTVVP